MKIKLLSFFGALLMTVALLFAPVSQAEARPSKSQLGCTYRIIGKYSFAGERVEVRCNGPYFKGGKKWFQAYALCDRLGWQPHRVSYGDRRYSGVSIAYCDRIGDWGIEGYGVVYQG